MTVEPADDGFTMAVERGDGLTITAAVRMTKGRRVCRRLELSTERGQIDRDVLHTIGLATLLRQAAAAAAAPPGRMSLTGPHQLNDEFLALVAATYRRALKDGENTASAVARLGRDIPGRNGKDAPLSTARGWIHSARPRFLKRTVKGRKGG